jgi:hypothetical protein
MVAPNIVETERRLEVDPHDFRLWVALHEVTHRTQFTAVPWMHDHVRGEISTLLEATSLDDPAQLVERLKSVVTGLPKGGSLVELLQTPEQSVVLDRVTAVHEPARGPRRARHGRRRPRGGAEREHIRAKFDERRKEHGGTARPRAAQAARAWTSRRCSTPRARSSSTPPSRARHGRLQPRVGVAGDAADRHEIREPQDWVRRSTHPRWITARPLSPRT